MINDFDVSKTVYKSKEAFNQNLGISLESVANKGDKNCINSSKLYQNKTLSNVTFMSKLKEISESQLIGYK